MKRLQNNFNTAINKSERERRVCCKHLGAFFFFPQEASRTKIISHCIKFDAYFPWWGVLFLFFFLSVTKSWLLLDTARLCWMDFYDALSAPLTGFMRCEVTAVKLKVRCYGGPQGKSASSALVRSHCCPMEKEKLAAFSLSVNKKMVTS